ncbi:MAG: preprotein translocase subunit SecG [Pseudomonadota bacterium]
MTAIILTIHTMVVLALVGVVLLQRSEGGALGMGGGGGGLMSGRGAATALTRTTTILAGIFFVTSLTLALVADRGQSEIDFLPTEEEALDEDDFSDIIGAADDGTVEAPAEATDIFTLPDDLGVDTDVPATEDMTDDVPPAEDNPLN